MKSMLYVGATLMIGASIYGFVDYNQTSQEKEFKTMYESNELTVKEEVKAPVAEKNVAEVTERKAKTRKNTVVVAKMKEDKVVITPVKPITEESMIKGETKSIAKTEAKVITVKQPAVKKTKSKKLHLREFSRAPLRKERIVVEEPITEMKKKEVKEE